MGFSLRIYRTAQGREPFHDWFRAIRDPVIRYRIEARLGRIKSGELGAIRHVGDEVWGIKLPFGPGYRIYYSRVGEDVIVILGAGHKGTQSRDIRLAQRYYRDYKARIRASMG